MSAVRLFFIAAVSLFWVGCQTEKKEKIQEIGNIDREAIAADTLMQHNLEKSFEYQQDLIKDLKTIVHLKAVQYTENGKVTSKTVILEKTTEQTDTLFHSTDFFRVKKAGLTEKKDALLLFCTIHETDSASLFAFDLKKKQFGAPSSFAIGQRQYQVQYEPNRFRIIASAAETTTAEILYNNNQFSIQKK